MNIDLKHNIKPVWSEPFTIANPEWKYESCTPKRGIQCSKKAKAYHNKYLTFDRFYMKSDVELLEINSKFGLICNNYKKGALYLVNSSKNTISIHANFTGTYDIPEVKVEKDIAFDLQLNSNYVLEVSKIGWTHTFSITDANSGKSTSIKFNNAKEFDYKTYCGKGWGGPGVISLEGSILFKNHNYSNALFPKAKVLFLGDSITEGSNMGPTVSIEDRWCSQLREKLLNGNAVISGRGGADIDNCTTRYNDMIKLGFEFETVVLLDGMNERSPEGVENWKIKVEQLVDIFTNNGSDFVVCINPVPGGGNEFLQEMRDFILSKNWKTVRFDYALSLNNDGESYDPTFYTDGVHPNKKGQDAMFKQAFIDLEFLK